MDIKKFTLRLTPEQHEVLERKAREEGISKNEYLAHLLEKVDSSDKYEAILEKLDELLVYAKKEKRP